LSGRTLRKKFLKLLKKATNNKNNYHKLEDVTVTLENQKTFFKQVGLSDFSALKAKEEF
jgi:hypothetical protein